MEIFSAITSLLTAAFSIWNTIEKDKYADQQIKLEKEWYDEFNKPENERDNSVLDNCMLQLRILTSDVASAITKSSSASVSAK